MISWGKIIHCYGFFVWDFKVLLVLDGSMDWMEPRMHAMMISGGSSTQLCWVSRDWSNVLIF